MLYLWAFAGAACLFTPLLRSWQYLSIPIIVLLHLYVAPYTKVEESFNIQAIHDLVQYGIPTSNSKLKLKALFDHMTYPGSVPRTFVGALITAGLSKPFTLLKISDGVDKQSTVRAVLGLLNAAALVTYIRAVKKAYGAQTASWYTFFQASQFHVFFYASRTLPNTFAFCISTFAMASFLPDLSTGLENATRITRLRRGFYLLTFAAVLFRSELALLVASYAGYLILKSGSVNGSFGLIRRVILPAVTIAGVASVLISVPIDTFFWQSDHFILPELEAFWFNIFPKDHQGASAWGTSPWHWYFTSAIPRMISFPTLLLIPYGLLFTAQKTSILDSLVPALSYATTYSILPHKETRFLFPIIPALTLSTAIPASYLSLRHTRTSKLFTTLLILTTTFTAIVSHLILLPLSSHSYPGAAAMQVLHATHNASLSNHPINVHLTNLALQSGITRFLEQPASSPQPPWIYDKSSTPTTPDPKFWSQFDYLVIEPESLTYLDPKQWVPKVSIGALDQAPPRLLGPGAFPAGCLVLDCGVKRDDRLYVLLQSMYGPSIAKIYGVLHDVLREGYGVGGMSLTKGYWIDWGMEERLVVMEQIKNERAVERRKEQWQMGADRPHVETWM